MRIVQSLAKTMKDSSLRFGSARPALFESVSRGPGHSGLCGKFTLADHEAFSQLSEGIVH